MANLFKNHSIDAIEKCMADALTQLLGRNTKVDISHVETTGFYGTGIKATVTATSDFDIADAPRRQRFEG